MLTAADSGQAIAQDPLLAQPVVRQQRTAPGGAQGQDLPESRVAAQQLRALGFLLLQALNHADLRLAALGDAGYGRIDRQRFRGGGPQGRQQQLRRHLRIA